jgi:phospholipid/cholesterol/gamma-HCH transport system substrate-binding protein
MAAFVALLVLAFWVSGLTTMGNSDYYTLHADFDNIGGLKVRAPVAIAGVKVGKVTDITLDPKTFRARVTVHIENSVHDIPFDSSASILTQGLLGANYISITPGFEEKELKPGGMIETTHSALILENIVGQLIYNVKNDDKKSEPKNEKI